MGPHTNYLFLVLTLLRLKTELYRIKDPRLQPLIELLKTKSIELNEEGEEKAPSNKEIADELGFKVARSNSMLKQVLEKLYEDFDNNPLKIDKVTHRVIIMYDHAEYQKFKNNPYATDSKSLFIELELIETPRIGEQIEFEVVPTKYIARGTVEEIRHIIEGKTQCIEIRCHPWRGRYAYWVKMKEEYDEFQRDLAFWKYMNRDKKT